MRIISFLPLRSLRSIVVPPRVATPRRRPVIIITHAPLWRVFVKEEKKGGEDKADGCLGEGGNLEEPTQSVSECEAGASHYT